MTRSRTPRADAHPADFTPSPFTPVATRARHDGWSPERQVRFIEALGQSGCIEEACTHVGMSSQSAYALRQRPDAQSFRLAWDAALDYAIRRLSDAAFSRALHGVATPVFYKGEKVGERRRFDERLTMFLLRYRDPVRYGAWLDGQIAQRHEDDAAITLLKMLNRVLDDAHADAAGAPRPDHPPIAFTVRLSPEQEARQVLTAAGPAPRPERPAQGRRRTGR